jgi:hypothetical protein
MDLIQPAALSQREGTTEGTTDHTGGGGAIEEQFPRTFYDHLSTNGKNPNANLVTNKYSTHRDIPCAIRGA